MTSFWFCSLYHARSLRDEEEAARRAAELLSAPCLHALTRVAVRIKDREQNHRPKSTSQLNEFLRKPAAVAVVLDSGRAGDLIGLGEVTLALTYKPDANIPAPMCSYVVVPYVADERDAVLEVFCGLAEVLDAAYGAVSVEPSFETAQNAALAQVPSSKDRDSYVVMTPARTRYRRTPWYYATEIARSIGGPEWGTFLGPEHLAKQSLDTMVASGAFHQVRPLGHRGAFLRLSEDPLDAQSEKIVDLVDKGRAALEPLVIDVSAVKI